MTFHYDTPPSDLAHFEGAFSGSEVGEVMHLLQTVECFLDSALEQVPTEAGALWTVSSNRDGLATISRLGVKYVFAAGSLEATMRKVEMWAQEQGDCEL